MSLLRDMTSYGSRPYPLDRERRRRVMIALAEKDMTISTLAKKLNISKQYVSAVVSGRRWSLKTQQRIAKFLGKPSAYLFPSREPEEIRKMRQAEQSAPHKRKV